MPTILIAQDNEPSRDVLTRRLARSTQHMPIIVLSAHAMTTDRELALPAGGDEFDTKPVRFPQLQKIEFLLTRGAVAR
jgi:CheY-like chemotaxis protein